MFLYETGMCYDENKLFKNKSNNTRRKWNVSGKPYETDQAKVCKLGRFVPNSSPQTK
jgi:hypothetical protein